MSEQDVDVTETFEEVERPETDANGYSNTRTAMTDSFLETAKTGKAILVPFGKMTRNQINSRLQSAAKRHGFTYRSRTTEKGLIVWAEAKPLAEPITGPSAEEPVSGQS